MASEFNKQLPMMVDAGTRLDSTIGINRSVRYNYTLVNYAEEELEASALEQAMRSKLINNVCTTKEMEIFVKNNIPVSFAYYGKNGKQVTVITVPASNCRDGSGIEGLAKDKPVVYQIENSKGENIYTGVAKRGRVEERLKEHLPVAQDAIRGGAKVKIQQKPSIAEALKTEARIINQQQPVQNKKGK